MMLNNRLFNPLTIINIYIYNCIIFKSHLIIIIIKKKKNLTNN